MKKIFILVLFTLIISACSDSQDTTAEATKSVVKFSKEVLGGISSGIDEGRKEAEGIDGAVIVTNIEELEQNVEIELLKVRSLNNDQKTEIEIGLKNSSEKPIRIANLDDRATVLLMRLPSHQKQVKNTIYFLISPYQKLRYLDYGIKNMK